MCEASAGSLESGDALVVISRAEAGSMACLDIQSAVQVQFGARIAEVVLSALREMHLDGVRVEIRDRGALDYVIRARVKSAAERLLRKEEESAT